MNIKDIINRIKSIFSPVKKLNAGQPTVQVPKHTSFADSLKYKLAKPLTQASSLGELLTESQLTSSEISKLGPLGRNAQTHEIHSQLVASGLFGNLAILVQTNYVRYAFLKYCQSRNLHSADAILLAIQNKNLLTDLKSCKLSYTQQVQDKEYTLEQILELEFAALQKQNPKNFQFNSNVSKEVFIETVVRLTMRGEQTNLRQCVLEGKQLAIDEAIYRQMKSQQQDSEISEATHNSEFVEQHESIMHDLASLLINDSTMDPDTKNYVLSVINAYYKGDQPGLVSPQSNEQMRRLLQGVVPCLEPNSKLSPIYARAVLDSLVRNLSSLGIVSPSPEKEDFELNK